MTGYCGALSSDCGLWTVGILVVRTVRYLAGRFVRGYTVLFGCEFLYFIGKVSVTLTKLLEEHWSYSLSHQSSICNSNANMPMYSTLQQRAELVAACSSNLFLVSLHTTKKVLKPFSASVSQSHNFPNSSQPIC